MKLTCSNLTVPSVFPVISSAPSMSLMEDSVLITSYILSAAIPALGRNIAMLAIMRKEKTISIEYAMNAVIVPTWSSPMSILRAATHVIHTLSPYMMIMRTGVMDIIVLLTNN